MSIAPETDFLIISHDGPVTTLTINRPHALNAIHPPLHEALQEALDRFATDPDQRICVITATGGRAFCVGSDLKHIAARRAEGREATPMPASGYAGIAQRFDLSKPVIAAVNGMALGGGFEIALACDLIIATHDARFGLPEVKVGGFAIAGGAARLARQIPLKRAMAMILTGDPISADEAFRLGLVNELVAPADLPDATRRWCERLLAGAPAAASLAKQAMMRSLDEPGLAEAMQAQAGYPAYRAWMAANEMREGSAAFAEKRPPAWRAVVAGKADLQV